MMNAIIGELSFENKKDLARYKPWYLRRQVLWPILCCLRTLLKIWLKDNIRSVYGGLDKEGGGAI